MDDSFQMHRKQRRPIISSDESEDEDDILESSQPEETYLGTAITTPHHFFSSNPRENREVVPDEGSSGILDSSLEDSFVNATKVQVAAECSRNEVAETDDSNIEESSSDSDEAVLSGEEIEISDSEVKAEKSLDKVLSPVKDAVEFAKPVAAIKEESNAAESPSRNYDRRRSFKNIKAELAAVELQLEESKELLSSLDTTIPDNGQNIENSILSLECIKEELRSELARLKPNSPFKVRPVEDAVKMPTPKPVDTSLNPSEEGTSEPYWSDDECAIVEEKLSPFSDDHSGRGSEISISILRTALKEKVSHNTSDIVNSPQRSVSPADWSKLPTTAPVDTGAFGKQAMKTFTTQQSLTVETLTTLHSALKSCPSEDTLEEDPPGLKVPLMPHQKHALAWLLWRERERPSGGILADDMGLGKTLTMVSLILKSMQDDKENPDSDDDDEENGWTEAKNRKMPRGGTLVVCPASLVGQWESEIKRRCDKGLLSVLLYHGSYRETRVKRIARKDVVITTYNLMGRESGVQTAKNCTEIKSPGPLHSIKWKRVILDEAHIVRNHKSQTALGVFELPAKHRWCLTGTPIQNKELDLFSLLKFLRCSPFDDLVVWKRWVDNKNAAGMQRLATMMKSLMLRRTKEQLNQKGACLDLPTKDYEVISVKLDREELHIYKKVALFSSTLFMQFLGQRAEKEQVNEARWGQSNLPTWQQGDRPDNQFFNNKDTVEMYRKMKVGNTEIKSHQILVLLLRLRQICCHPGLIKEMLLKEDFSTAGVDDDTDDVDEDLFSAMEKLAISAGTGNGEEDEDGENTTSSPTPGSPSPSKTPGPSALRPDNPILDFSRPSSKIRAVLDVILEKVIDTDDKAVVVSQWTSMLNIVHDHLKEMGVKCEMLSGNVPVPKRMEMVHDFNSKRNKFQVLLLSLTAGGVGLNLVGGNHLFLMDVHWNPQLEAQACDRVYRVGQKKPVHIYKFVCADTVEERIKCLQERKLAIADSVLTGTKNTQASKLTLQDLKMLFGVGLPQPDF